VRSYLLALDSTDEWNSLEILSYTGGSLGNQICATVIKSFLTPPPFSPPPHQPRTRLGYSACEHPVELLEGSIEFNLRHLGASSAQGACGGEPPVPRIRRAHLISQGRSRLGYRPDRWLVALQVFSVSFADFPLALLLGPQLAQGTCPRNGN
jgi:hypothetical protein